MTKYNLPGFGYERDIYPKSGVKLSWLGSSHQTVSTQKWLLAVTVNPT